MTLNVPALRTVAVTAALAAALVGCSSSGGKSGSAATANSGGGTFGGTAAATASAGAAGTATSGSPFCSTLSDYATRFKAVTSENDLSTVKKELPSLVAGGQKATSGAPAEIKSDVTALVSDIAAINDWIQHKATQKELTGNDVPPVVAKPFADLEQRLSTLQAWYGKNCKGTLGG